jgi:tripartite-type tricarboxylate transporter receptor subunit TctC
VKRTTTSLMAAALAAIIVHAAPARAEYPERPIRIVVPFAPGGVADNTTRQIAQELASRLEQSVVVENKPGGAAIIGAQTVAKAAPDGYTLLLGTTNISTNPALYKKLPYEDKELVPVAFVLSTPGVIITHASVPVKTFPELLAYAQQNPGKISYASVGLGSFSHLAVEGLQQKTGMKMVHVPYKGYAPAFAAVLGGESQLLVSDLQGALPYLQSGKINVLAITGARRLAALPKVPTVQESGVKDFEASGWLGIMAPAGTPAAVIAKLNAEINRALLKPGVAQRFAEQGNETRPGDPAAFHKFLGENKAAWEKIIKTGNISLD